jgi:hypothetical protein
MSLSNALMVVVSVIVAKFELVTGTSTPLRSAAVSLPLGLLLWRSGIFVRMSARRGAQFQWPRVNPSQDVKKLRRAYPVDEFAAKNRENILYQSSQDFAAV